MDEVTHPFDKYLHAHGHYPRARLACGSRKRIEVQVAPGYLIVSTAPPPHTTYIPRDTLIPLLKWLIPLVKQMGVSFDVEDAMHQSYLLESQILEEQRSLKRQLYGRRRAR